MRRIPAFLFLTAAFPLLVSAETWLVVPFTNLTPKPTLEWIGESIAESISEAMTRQNMLVVNRELRKEAEGRLALRSGIPWTRGTMLKLAESLDADYLVFGSYEHMPSSDLNGMGMLHLKSETVNVRELRRGGVFQENGPIEDLALLQSHLAWQVLRASRPGNAPSEEEFKRSRLTVRLDALEHYMRGLLATKAEAQERFFQQAIRLEPRYSQASFQYGRLLAERDSQALAAQNLEKVQPWDPHYREATFLLGLARFKLKEFRPAEAAFLRLNRDVPLSEVLNNLGVAQWRLGLPEAMENLRRALEGDDKDPTYHFNLGLALLSRGAFEDAAAQFRSTLERSPDDADATKLLGRCLRPQSGIPSREDLAGSERLKLEYEDSAYQQLKALIAPQKK